MHLKLVTKSFTAKSFTANSESSSVTVSLVIKSNNPVI